MVLTATRACVIVGLGQWRSQNFLTGGAHCAVADPEGGQGVMPPPKLMTV